MTDEDELARVRLAQQKKEAGEPPDNIAPLQPPAEQAPELSPEMRLMFGASFDPQPFGYVVTRGDLHGHSCLFLTFEYAHGRFSVPLSDLEAQGMANRLTQMARDQLVIARDIPHAPG